MLLVSLLKKEMKYRVLSILFTAIGFFFSLPESVRAQVQRDRYYSIYFEIADGISEDQVLSQLDEESTQKMDPGYLTVLPASEYNRLKCKFYRVILKLKLIRA